MILTGTAAFFVLTQGDASHISFDSLVLTAESKSTYPAKNTDGIDIGGSTYTTVRNISVTNTDDCMAFKAGANYVTVDGITCKGSHGISVGSLGGTPGKTDTVQNIYVTNANMQGATKAVGIKLWPGGPDHGSAIVRNITWDGFTVDNCDYAAQIQTCYASDASYCASNPSTVQVTDVYLKNFKGTTSSKYSPTIANMNCPGNGQCNVYFSGWSVKPPTGTARYLCANVDSNPGVTCTAGASG
jgi:galacturan 1,4-alpha-galacturonidase